MPKLFLLVSLFMGCCTSLKAQEDTLTFQASANLKIDGYLSYENTVAMEGGSFWLLAPSHIIPRVVLSNDTLSPQFLFEQNLHGRLSYLSCFFIKSVDTADITILSKKWDDYSTKKPLTVYRLTALNLNKRIKVLEDQKDSKERITYFLIGALSLLSLISFLIFLRQKNVLFFYYFLYGFSALCLVLLRNFFESAFLKDFAFYENWYLYTRVPDFLQMISLWAYIHFVLKLLNLENSNLRIAKVLKWLAHLLILWGIIEVISLLYFKDIQLYDTLIGASSAVLFPIFILVIIFLSVIVKHHLVKYVILSNAIFVGILLLGFSQFFLFPQWAKSSQAGILLSLPFATMLEAVVLSIALAAKIKYDTNQRVVAERQLAKVEMAALRSQMNPHFLFNSMNSIRSMILSGENKKAEKYLVSFSKLLRWILEYSREDTITLLQEIETMQLYLSLEASRFDESFKYEFNIADDVELELFLIPPLLLQPFLENAIIHGLKNSSKPSKELTISIESFDLDSVRILIDDNGVGRKVSELNKLETFTKQSLGTAITQERVSLYNDNVYGKISMETIDTKDGTRVIIELNVSN